MNQFLILCFCLLAVMPMNAQQTLPQYEKAIEEQGDILITSKDSKLRDAAFENIHQLLEKALQLDSSFAYPFDGLKRISLQTAPDGVFRIFSWQHYTGEDTYLYGGIIQQQKGNRVTVLRDEKSAVLDPEFDILSPEEWYGSVYYNIKPFKSKNGMMYLLFGFNGHTIMENQKVIEVLKIDKKGEITFGGPAFFKPKSKRADKHRLVITYSAEIVVNLNYDPTLDLIIQDHLTLGSNIRGEAVFVPDGTYQGYELKGNKWVFNDKLFYKVLDEAPREMPVLDNRKGKNILGQ